MAESLGARLRQRREERQIDLIAIAAQTKIKVALLEGLERDDVSRWPSGIFRRAYIKSYAQIIGLDPESVLREFLEVHPDPGDVVVSLAAAPDAPEDASRNAAPQMRLRTLVDSAIGSLAKLRRASGPVRGALPSAAVNERVPIAAAPPDSPWIPSPPPDLLSADEMPGAGRPSPHTDPFPPPPPSAASADGGLSEAVMASASSIAEVSTPAVPEAPVEADATPHPPQPEDDGRFQDDAGDRIRELQASHDAVLEAVAQLCSDLGRAVEREELAILMQDAARLLNAAGLIVWLCDETAQELSPALVHGYPDRLVAQLPTVTRDADNATAAAFRSGRTCEVAATAHASGALVVPLLVPEGCAGVLAVELQHGIEPTKSGRAIASIVAAALAQLVYRTQQQVEDNPPVAATPARVTESRPPAPPIKVRR